VFEICCLRLEGGRLTFYIKPEDGLELPEIMKWMKQTFAQRYNRWAGWIGHVWGDRYWSRILEGEPPEEPPEEGTGGRVEASNTGVRPLKGKNGGKPGFSPISPHPAAPTPGEAAENRLLARIKHVSRPGQSPQREESTLKQTIKLNCGSSFD
ncbi:MAG: hypothetical protein LBP80_06310, partial [Treponema sp.]|nr:hypothetical protein [Treponema sp.]